MLDTRAVTLCVTDVGGDREPLGDPEVDFVGLLLAVIETEAEEEPETETEAKPEPVTATVTVAVA